MIDITTELSGLKLSNPVIPASGTFGYGEEFAELYEIYLAQSALKAQPKTQDTEMNFQELRNAQAA